MTGLNFAKGAARIRAATFILCALPLPVLAAPQPSEDGVPPADVVLFADLTAEEACAKATLPAGFRMHVFAAEPDVRQPIAFCEDDRGRLWVAEGITYPKRAEEGKGQDRILVFEDTNGDHHFDRRTVFLENLNLVSGIEYGFGGLWIGAAPYLMFVPIIEGDEPKPGGPPQILLDGWDYRVDTHETLNTFSWGPDGWLYGCHGVFCPSHVGKPGAPEKERQWVDAAAWRYHPIRHQFEIFTEGGSNPWGIDFDAYGQLWSEMCVIPHLFQMIQGARITRQGGEHYCLSSDETERNQKSRDPKSRKPIYPFVYEEITTHADHLHYAGSKGPHAANGRSDAAGGGHAHAGLMVYLGDSWPAEYHGGIFIGNIHGQRLNVDIPVPMGSGYIAHHGRDFLSFNDTWSQTLNQRSDPDGSVYVIDWYDKNQCHHNREDGHDRSNGRIYKIVYHDRKPAQVDLQKLGNAELIELQSYPNEWQARHARRILQERAVQTPLEPQQRRRLSEGVGNNPNTALKLRALWTLHRSGGLEASAIERFLGSPDEQIRGWTIQLATEGRQLTAAQASEFAKLARRDPSPVVRRFLASALQRLPPPQRWDVLTALVSHAEDSTDHNLPLLYWYAAEGAVASDPERAFALLRAARIPKVREFIARRLASLAVAQLGSTAGGGP